MEQGRTLTNSYAFIRHIPVVIVMSVSHINRYAMTQVEQRQRNSDPYTSFWFQFVLFGLLSEKYLVITVRLLLTGR